MIQIISNNLQELNNLSYSKQFSQLQSLKSKKIKSICFFNSMTPDYIAPEVIRQKGYEQEIDLLVISIIF